MRRVVWALAIGVTLVAGGQDQAPPFPHELSDLDPDPRVTWGRLENGFRYAILQHPVPLERASLFLLVQAGSYHEEDDERGYAHFVEHMAFNGTRDFPGHAAIEELQRLGLPFGSHTNATTTRFETTYNIDELPTQEPGALKTGLRILRDFADGIMFEEREVRRERQVIFSERRSGAGEMLRYWIPGLNFTDPEQPSLISHELDGLFDETRVEFRNPSGTPRSVRRATGAQLRAFYDRWYRPERMILAVVGDVDPAEIEIHIQESFASLKSHGERSDPPEIAEPREPREPYPRVFARRAVEPKMRVTLANAVATAGPDNAARRRLGILRQIALDRVAQRIKRAADFPVTVDAWIENHVPGWDLPLIRVVTDPDSLRDSAVIADMELRRALDYGFSASEIELGAEDARSRAARNAIEARKLSSAATAEILAFSIARDVVFTAAEEERGAVEQMLADLTPADCLKSLRDLWPLHRMQVILVGNFSLRNIRSGSVQGSLRKALHLARAVPPVPDFPSLERTELHFEFGPPGSVAHDDYDKALDCRFIEFANGVRLNLKATASERDRVRLRINFGHGMLGAPRHHPELADANVFLMNGGIREPESDSSESRTIHAGFRGTTTLDADHFRMQAEIQPSELIRYLRIFAAHLIAPAFDPDQEASSRAAIEAQRPRLEQTATHVGRNAFRRFAFNDHPSIRRATINEARHATLEDYKQWLMPQLLESPLEVTIVGDIDPESVIEQVAQTFGALPPRATSDPLAERRLHTPPDFPIRENIRFKGRRSVGTALMGWVMENEPGFADDCRRNLLAAIIKDRLRVRLREEMGDTYSPQASASENTALDPPMSAIICSAEARPNRVGRVGRAMRQVVAELVRDGVTVEELERASRPFVRLFETSLLDNEWWLDAVDEAQTKPWTIQGLLDQRRHYQAATVEDINAAVRTILVPDRQCELRVLPE